MPGFPAVRLESLIRLRQAASSCRTFAMFYFTPPSSYSGYLLLWLPPWFFLQAGLWMPCPLKLKEEKKKRERERESPAQPVVLFLGVCDVVLGQRCMEGGGWEEAVLIRWRLERKIPFETVLKAFSFLLNHCTLLSQAHHPWKPQANSSAALSPMSESKSLASLHFQSNTV